MPLIIIFKYAINGLITHLQGWEDQGWIGIKNAELFKRATYQLKKCTAKTSFQWTKGHTGDQGNEDSDQLAKVGANKDCVNKLDLSILPNYDLQGAKLAMLSQKKPTEESGNKKKHAPEK